jgi:hypothetical protein
MAGRATLAAASAALGVAAAVATSALAGEDASRVCTPKFASGAMHLCGPATAHLSVFGTYKFENGTCKRSGDTFVLELGAIKVPPGTTNGGLSYLKIQIDGPLSNPTSGSLIAYHSGKRWAGYGESFRGTAKGGTFVVKGSPKGAAIGPTSKLAHGDFHC